MSTVNRVLRPSGTVHDFVVFFTSRIATKESQLELQIWNDSKSSYTRFLSFSMFVISAKFAVCRE